MGKMAFLVQGWGFEKGVPTVIFTVPFVVKFGSESLILGWDRGSEVSKRAKIDVNPYSFTGV